MPGIRRILAGPARLCRAPAAAHVQPVCERLPVHGRDDRGSGQRSTVFPVTGTRCCRIQPRCARRPTSSPATDASPTPAASSPARAAPVRRRRRPRAPEGVRRRVALPRPPRPHGGRGPAELRQEAHRPGASSRRSWRRCWRAATSTTPRSPGASPRTGATSTQWGADRIERRLLELGVDRHLIARGGRRGRARRARGGVRAAGAPLPGPAGDAARPRPRARVPRPQGLRPRVGLRRPAPPRGRIVEY